MMLFSINVPVIDVALSTLMFWMAVVLLVARFLAHIFGLGGRGEGE
jgi:hypothetical protein